jgi:hypothetical protein
MVFYERQLDWLYAPGVGEAAISKKVFQKELYNFEIVY